MSGVRYTHWQSHQVYVCCPLSYTLLLPFICSRTVLRIGWVALPGLLPWVRHTKQNSRQLEGVVQVTISCQVGHGSCCTRLESLVDNGATYYIYPDSSLHQRTGFRLLRGSFFSRIFVLLEHTTPLTNAMTVMDPTVVGHVLLGALTT